MNHQQYYGDKTLPDMENDLFTQACINATEHGMSEAINSVTSLKSKRQIARALTTFQLQAESQGYVTQNSIHRFNEGLKARQADRSHRAEQSTLGTTSFATGGFFTAGNTARFTAFLAVIGISYHMIGGLL